MQYKVYGWFRQCEKCCSTQPLAVGIAHNSATIRLIKFRTLRKTFTPECIRAYPKNYELFPIHANLDWETAYTLVEEYKQNNIKVLTCSRT